MMVALKLIKANFYFQWALILGLCILARLPHILTEKYFFFDDDEALIGIMAQEMLRGELFPYFFCGQNYGLSFFETASVAGCIKIFGSGIWALRIGGLLLFSLGITFIHKTLKQRNMSFLLSAGIAVLLITFPTWYLWGAMVRGGYVTSFVAVSIIFYVTQKKEAFRFDSFLMGFLLYTAYESHVLILIPVLPFVFEWWRKKPQKWMSAIKIISTSLLLIYGLRYLFSIEHQSYLNPISIDKMKLSSLLTYLSEWTHSFSGFYFYNVNFNPPDYWHVGLYILLAVMVVTIVLGVWNIESKKRIIAVLCLMAIVFSFLVLAQVEDYSPRYMIGCYTGLLFLVLYLIVNSEFYLKKTLVYAMALISFIGITTGSKMPRHWYFGQESFLTSFDRIHDYAIENDVDAVIALDNQYVWNYLYGDEIPATNLCWNNRTNKFSDKVHSIFNQDTSRVMMTGFEGITWGINEVEGFNDSIIHVAPDFFVLRIVSNLHLMKGKENYTCY